MADSSPITLPEVNVAVLANARSSNIGNGALLEGTLRVLREDFPSKIFSRVLPWDEYSFQRKDFDEDFIADINEKSDLLLVIGAVTFNGRPYYTRGGMRFDLDPEQMAGIKKPVVFYGLSYRFWGGTEYGHLDKLKAAIDYIDGREDFLLALRDDGSMEWLTKMVGFPLTSAVTIPDPAMFVPHGSEHAAKSDQKQVFISLNNEDAATRFREPDSLALLLDAIASAITHVVEKWNAQVTIVNHYFDDLELVNPLLNRLAPWIAHMHVESVGPAHIRDTEGFYSHYERADVVISMRVHSMTPAVGMGIPCIILESQDRISSFSKKLGLQDMTIGIYDQELPSKLLTLLDNTLTNQDEIPNKTKVEVARRRQVLRDFNVKVAGLLR